MSARIVAEFFADSASEYDGVGTIGKSKYAPR